MTNVHSEKSFFQSMKNIQSIEEYSFKGKKAY